MKQVVTVVTVVTVLKYLSFFCHHLAHEVVTGGDRTAHHTRATKRRPKGRPRIFGHWSCTQGLSCFAADAKSLSRSRMPSAVIITSDRFSKSPARTQCTWASFLPLPSPEYR